MWYCYWYMYDGQERSVIRQKSNIVLCDRLNSRTTVSNFQTMIANNGKLWVVRGIKRVEILMIFSLEFNFPKSLAELSTCISGVIQWQRMNLFSQLDSKKIRSCVTETQGELFIMKFYILPIFQKNDLVWELFDFKVSTQQPEKNEMRDEIIKLWIVVPKHYQINWAFYYQFFFLSFFLSSLTFILCQIIQISHFYFSFFDFESTSNLNLVNLTKVKF